MLPSTGYFKTINCPFYDSGLCERPYCHFKHPRREDAAATSGTAVQAAMVGSQSATATTASTNSEMLQQLVSEAVKKVLAHQEVTDTDKFSENIVSQVVEGLKPTLGSSSLASSSASIEDTILPSVISEHAIVIPPPAAKPTPCVYNPTPIAELRKRHIPVASYMPTRNSKIAVKRKTSPDRHKPWLSVFQDSPGMHDASSIPSYPSVKVGEITYKPTAIVTPSDAMSAQSYIPTAKSDTSSSNSYEDSNSNDYLLKTKEEYRPRSKRRREEYVPKKLKAPLKTVRQLDETVLDQFEPEFDIIDEILTAEKKSPSVVVSEESQDYDLEAEPKFSDDEEEEQEEPVDENAENSTKEANKLEAKLKDTDNNVEEKENEDKERHKRIDVKDKNNDSSKSDQKSSSHSSSKSKDSHSSSKSNEDTGSSKSRERRDSHGKDRSKSKDKSNKDESRKEKGKGKKEHKSSSNNHDRNNKESSGRDKNYKEKHKHNSSVKEKPHSSSSNKEKDSHSAKEKHKSTHSSKESSYKNRDTSRSGKESSSRDKNKDKNKSNHHDKHKNKLSSSRSKKDKSSSDKTSEKKHSHSRSKSTSSRSKKTERRRGSNGESSVGEHEDQDSPTRSIRSASPIYDEVLEISDSDHDVEEECLKIFQEYEDSDHPKEVTVKEAPKRELEEVDEPARKRVAHPSASHSVVRQIGPTHPLKRLPNPQQRMYERWRLMKEAAAATAVGKAATVNSKVPSAHPTQLPLAVAPQAAEHPPNAATDKSEEQTNGNGRIRIAHVPYATSLALAKKKVAEVASKASESKTLAQTSKAGARVAHIPQVVPQLLRPEPLQATTQKFPLNVRQHYVNLMQDICVQIYTTAEDAAQRALREEFACHERCKAVAVYKNSCMLAAHRLRKELDQRSSGDVGRPSASGMVSHEALLAGKHKGSWSVVKTKRAVTEFKGAALYMMLSKWIMTEQQLRDNGFPRPHPDGPPGRAKVYVTNTRNQSILSKVPNERFCCRCGQSYMVDKHGSAVRQQNCIYHWGRKFTIRGEGKYSCCQQYGSATGCCDAKTHVWEHVDYENLRGYVMTLPKDHINVEEQGVYALDCEMSYTTQGLELTRVTVINEDLNVVYETLVKPVNPVIDYNTRFSGITEEQMEGVSTSLLDVQATLLTMFSDKTILIGHSLESDFKTLKLLHDTVVDTSVMFPHKNGYPHKRALRNLCSEYLRKIIQNDVGGHDSNEDAVACMELVMWKMKEEAKLQ